MLIVSAVATTIVAFNVRPSYPNWINRSSPITGAPHTLMRQYGWPFGCVDAYPNSDLNSIGRIVTVYEVEEIRWLPIFGNLAFCLAACYVSVRTYKTLFGPQSMERENDVHS